MSHSPPKISTSASLLEPHFWILVLLREQFLACSCFFFHLHSSSYSPVGDGNLQILMYPTATVELIKTCRLGHGAKSGTGYTRFPRCFVNGVWCCGFQPPPPWFSLLRVDHSPRLANSFLSALPRLGTRTRPTRRLLDADAYHASIFY